MIQVIKIKKKQRRISMSKKAKTIYEQAREEVNKYYKKEYTYKAKSDISDIDKRLSTKDAVEFSTAYDLTLQKIADRLFSVYYNTFGSSERTKSDNLFLDSVIFSYACEHITDISDNNIDKLVALSTGRIKTQFQLDSDTYVREICEDVQEGRTSSRLDWYHLRYYHRDTISKETFERYRRDAVSSIQQKIITVAKA